MPIYEYRCAACGHKLEALQKFTEAPLSDCPVCGKKSLSKLISLAGFHLKGSGWYATDFRSHRDVRQIRLDLRNGFIVGRGTGACASCRVRPRNERDCRHHRRHC